MSTCVFLMETCSCSIGAYSTRVSWSPARERHRRGYIFSVFIFDFQHFSWDNLDTRTAAATLKQGQDYHPERLKKAILFKAPTLFWTLWKLITPLMDAKTKSKFVFANNADELQRAGLVLERAPSTMGGGSHEEDWVPIERV